jgi:hippurate hydrolase
MPVVNRFADLMPEIMGWRQDLHRHPELLYDLPQTSAFVAGKLRSFGADEVATGLGGSGVVAVIRGKRAGKRAIGLRADMDALPILEAGKPPYVSQTPGKMHACGHDGHMAMLLGAARYLAETRNFAGTAVLIFQPAEEGGAGAKAMIDDGLLSRFPVDEVYGLHNLPGMPIGQFGIRPGPIMASTDSFRITVRGRGGHAAIPHETIDPIVVGAAIVQALQTVVSRTVDPIDSVVVSVTTFHAGDTHNVIAEEAQLGGTVRTLDENIRGRVEKMMAEMVDAVARAHRAAAVFAYHRGYPVTRNHSRETEFAARIAMEVAGSDKVATDTPPIMGAEDFSYMLEARPGAFIFMGNGNSAGLHNPNYDFADEAIPFGCSYWVKLVETAMPA